MLLNTIICLFIWKSIQTYFSAQIHSIFLKIFYFYFLAEKIKVNLYSFFFLFLLLWQLLILDRIFPMPTTNGKVKAHRKRGISVSWDRADFCRTFSLPSHLMVVLASSPFLESRLVNVFYGFAVTFWQSVTHIWYASNTKKLLYKLFFFSPKSILSFVGKNIQRWISEKFIIYHATL